MTTLGETLESALRIEHTTALRALLASPLIVASAEPDVFPLVVKHRQWLTDWFGSHPSWKLAVEPAHGFARLYKIAAAPDCSQPAHLAGKPPFDRRRYQLLCLTLAALDEGGAQTTIQRLAESVRAAALDAELVPLDADSIGERRAFVDVLRWLAERRILSLRDGDTDRYAQSSDGDALYDVDDRLLAHLIAAPVPPALAAERAHLAAEIYPATDEGERLRARHRVVRTLLDEPVLYYDDLDPREREWLEHSRAHLYRLLEEDVGLSLERRREGILAVDAAGIVTDTLFPDGSSTVKHAALLVCAHLTERCRERGDEEITDAEVRALAIDLNADYGERCGWSKQYDPAQGGAPRLAADAMELLAAFRLVARTPEGWRARPAIARFRAAPPRAGI